MITMMLHHINAIHHRVHFKYNREQKSWLLKRMFLITKFRQMDRQFLVAACLCCLNFTLCYSFKNFLQSQLLKTPSPVQYDFFFNPTCPCLYSLYKTDICVSVREPKIVFQESQKVIFSRLMVQTKQAKEAVQQAKSVAHVVLKTFVSYSFKVSRSDKLFDIQSVLERNPLIAACTQTAAQYWDTVYFGVALGGMTGNLDLKELYTLFSV